MSPHVLHLAPAWASWYAKQLLRTKLDRFALPPSGDLYAYPSMFPPAQQEAFVANTGRDATLLSTSVSTVWEFAMHWEKALKNYFPKFATRHIVNALVSVNVPYNIPALAFGKDRFKIVTSSRNDKNSSVVFAPHEWRGTRGSKLPWANEENLSVKAMAAEINAYKRGSVTAIYLTSDGGANLQDVDQLVAALAEHIVVVGNDIGEIALAAATRAGGT